MKKEYNAKGKLSFAQMYGRIPTPKPGGAMKAKKGKGSYSRNGKHKGRSNFDCPFFCFV